jgi:hypothetical protein
MKKNKVSFIKEKDLAKKADKLTKEFIENGYSENPIKAKMLAFRELKKDIKNKDIL